MARSKTPPVLVVIAGPSGSGKSSVTPQILADNGIESRRYINVDNILADELGGHQGISADILENVLRPRARSISLSRRERFLRTKRSFGYETVLSSREKYAVIDRGVALGFDVRLHYVGTSSVDINLARIRQRVAKGEHDVPESIVREGYNQSINLCIAAMSTSNHGVLYDNSIDSVPPRICLQTRDGTVTHVDIPTWTAQVMWPLLH